ncbi:hypothetical protein KIN20_002638, partial [Parelaphostrongylus tenuis]
KRHTSTDGLWTMLKILDITHTVYERRHLKYNWQTQLQFSSWSLDLPYVSRLRDSRSNTCTTEIA